MTAKFAPGGGKSAGGGLGRKGADGAGARVAEAHAAGGDYFVPAEYRGCEADAGAAEPRRRRIARRIAPRFVDVEGGTVDRLRDALAPIPSAQAVARAAAGDRARARWRASMAN